MSAADGCLVVLWTAATLYAVLGVGAPVLLVRRHPAWARLLAAGSVAAVAWAWAVAQWPYLLPTRLTVDDAAGDPETLKWVLVIFVVAIVVVVPALVLLFTLAQRGRLEAAREAVMPGGGDGAGRDALTTAELRVLGYLPTHLSFPAIAGRLNVSRFTVKTQAMAVYRKLGASSRAEAVDRAREIGLLA